MRTQKSGVSNQHEKRGSKTFQDLTVCQKTHQFLLSDYRSTEVFPKKYMYGFTSQSRRAAVSIAVNIAEPFRKTGKSDKLINAVI